MSQTNLISYAQNFANNPLLLGASYIFLYSILLYRTRRLERGILESVSQERNARIASEALLREDTTSLVAKSRAENDAHAMNVEAKIEGLSAKTQQLCNQVRDEANTLRQNDLSLTTSLQEMSEQMSKYSLKADMSSLEAQVIALQASVNELKGICVKPTRSVSVWFSIKMIDLGQNVYTPSTAVPIRVRLYVSYYIVPQNEFTPVGQIYEAYIDDNSGLTIQVPGRHKVFVANALVRNANAPAVINTGAGGSLRSIRTAAAQAALVIKDVTNLYKIMLESQ